MSFIYLQNTKILPLLEDDMNITRCKCSSLFQSNVDCFSSSAIRDETTAGENTSSSLHSVVRKKNPELFDRVQSTHVLSPWTLSSKLLTSQCLIHNSCPAHSVSVLQQTFGCQCESLQRMLVNVGLHRLWGEHMTSLWRGFSFPLYTINRQNLNKEIKERDRRERQKMMEVETKQKADKETRKGENKVQMICVDSHGDVCDSASPSRDSQLWFFFPGETWWTVQKQNCSSTLLQASHLTTTPHRRPLEGLLVASGQRASTNPLQEVNENTNNVASLFIQEVEEGVQLLQSQTGVQWVAPSSQSAPWTETEQQQSTELGALQSTLLPSVSYLCSTSFFFLLSKQS